MVSGEKSEHMRNYRIVYGSVDAPQVKDVLALYYQIDDRFTTFKDNLNKAVFMVRNDVLSTVERLGSPDESGDSSSDQHWA